MKYFLAVATGMGHRGNRNGTRGTGMGNRNGTQGEPWVYGVKVAGTGSQWRWADSGAPVELP